MKIGIDLSSLQGPHRMRGIGYTLINFINNLSVADRKSNTYVFYLYPDGVSDVLEILNLKDMVYEVRELMTRKKFKKVLPGRLKLLVSALNQLIELRDLHYGDSRLNKVNDIDVFLQSDQSQHLPRTSRKIVKALIIYDLIPFVLEWDYLWSYRTAREKGFSRKAALRVQARRTLYSYKIKVNVRRADKIIAISELTKQDFMRYLGVSGENIIVIPLGVNPPAANTSNMPELHRYVKTSWGYMKRSMDVDTNTPFLLFVGGADRRRKLEDVVTVFNNLRAQGYAIKLILAGDSMQGASSIATEEIQSALLTSSYLDEIIFMGFVDDKTRDWLYTHALAFVFPSRYEGFGLPVLEAMIQGSPVISYRNLATQEVAADAIIYADNLLSLSDAVKKLLSYSVGERAELVKIGKDRAELYDWRKTSKTIISSLLN